MERPTYNGYRSINAWWKLRRFVGVDLGATWVRVALADEDLKFFAREKERTDVSSEENLQRQLVRIVSKLLTETGTESVEAVGLADRSVQVELLDENNRPITGYTRKEATRLFDNSVNLTVTWGDNDSVAAMAGKPIKLRFLMRDCKLYAFQFVEN